MRTLLIIASAVMLLCATSSQPSEAAVPPVEVEAVDCVVTELQPCLSAITTGGPPSPQCCNKLKEQQPCLCGYMKNPAFSQYITSPNAHKVAAACGVPYPQC